MKRNRMGQGPTDSGFDGNPDIDWSSVVKVAGQMVLYGLAAAIVGYVNGYAGKRGELDAEFHDVRRRGR